MKLHYLKIEPRFYKEMISGFKTHEIRLNDRDYAVGDVVILNEYKDNKYTGYKIKLIIRHISSSSIGLKENYVILSFNEIIERPL